MAFNNVTLKLKMCNVSQSYRVSEVSSGNCQLNKLFKMESNDLVSAIRNYCSEFLGGVWQTNSHQIVVEKCKVGMSNRSFKCSIQTNETIENVIVKVYGTEHFSESKQFKSHCEAAEAIIFERLASSNLAPKLLGIFNGGRIEEYIQGRNMVLSDLNDISMYKAIARKLAHFHSQQMPITRKQFFIPYLKEQIETEPGSVSHLNASNQKIMQNLEELNVKKELSWFEGVAKKCNSKVVFSHNDLYLVNTLLRDDGDSSFDKFMIIDYELTDYGYRGHDLSSILYGNEFEIIANSDYFKIKYVGNTATDALKKMFAEEYLSEIKKICELKDESRDYVDHLIMEIEVFGLLVYLVLFSFTRVLVYNSICNTDSLENVNDVIQLYYSLKKYIISKYPELA